MLLRLLRKVVVRVKRTMVRDDVGHHPHGKRLLLYKPNGSDPWRCRSIGKLLLKIDKPANCPERLFGSFIRHQNSAD